MELHLTYEKFKNAQYKYDSLFRDNEKWLAGHEKAVEAVKKNQNSGHWEKNFQDKVKALTTIFMDYCERVNKMKATFEAADEYLGTMYSLCKMMPQVLKTGKFSDDTKISPSHAEDMELLYNSAKHDLIRDNCLDVDEASKEQYKLAERIFAMGERFEFVDFAYINRDITHLEKGIEKQQNVIPFLECFQTYVQKVNDFNTDISSQFASICEVLPDPEDGEGGEDGGSKKPAPKPRNDDGGAGQEGNQNVEEAADNSGAGYVAGTGAGAATAGASVAGAQRDGAFDAAANALFDRYKNNPDEFMKKYGFPLYDENGNYNYDKLYKDYFSYSTEKGGGLDEYLDAHGDKGAIGTGDADAAKDAPAAGSGSSSSSGSPKASAKAEEPVKLGLDRSQIV